MSVEVTSAADTIDVVPASVGDASCFADIHGSAFDRGWKLAEFERFLGEEHSLCLKACNGEGACVGFIVARQVADEAEIITFAVAPQHQGCGLGRRLLAKLIDMLRDRGVSALFLEVGANNEPARKLYKRSEFNEIGRRSGYYKGANGKKAEDCLNLKLIVKRG